MNPIYLLNSLQAPFNCPLHDVWFLFSEVIIGQVRKVNDIQVAVGPAHANATYIQVQRSCVFVHHKDWSLRIGVASCKWLSLSAWGSSCRVQTAIEQAYECSIYYNTYSIILHIWHLAYSANYCPVPIMYYNCYGWPNIRSTILTLTSKWNAPSLLKLECRDGALPCYRTSQQPMLDLWKSKFKDNVQELTLATVDEMGAEPQVRSIPHCHCNKGFMYTLVVSYRTITLIAQPIPIWVVHSDWQWWLRPAQIEYSILI